MKPTKQEINRLIDTYNFALPEGNPEGGGFVSDCFIELEEDHELQERILAYYHEIHEELLRRYREEKRIKILRSYLRRIK